MNLEESIMQGLIEAIDYQENKISARKTKLTIKPVAIFNTDDIKQICQKTYLNQIVLVSLLSVYPKTLVALGKYRNNLEDVSRHLLKIVNVDHGSLGRFLVKCNDI